MRRSARVDVRRLAAVDLYGLQGTSRRRRLVLVEFLLGLTVMTGAGVAIWLGSSDPQRRVFTAWLIGAGLNYAPLSAHAISLNRPGALERELSDVDVAAELRHYTLVQLWLFVPLSLVLFDLSRRRRRGPAP